MNQPRLRRSEQADFLVGACLDVGGGRSIQWP